VDLRGCYESFASRLDDKKQSAVIGSFEEQRMKWNTPPSYKPITARIFH